MNESPVGKKTTSPPKSERREKKAQRLATAEAKRARGAAKTEERLKRRANPTAGAETRGNGKPNRATRGDEPLTQRHHAGPLSGPIDLARSPAHARLRAHWIVPVAHPLLLISQIQRSGGTLLSRLFDDHPACFAHPYELSWGLTEKTHWPRLDLSARPDEIFESLEEPWLIRTVTRGYYAKGHLNLQSESLERHPFIFDRQLQTDLFRQLMVSRPPSCQRDVLNAYLTSFFNAWIDFQSLYRGPKQYVTAFTPRLIMDPVHQEGFFRDYPDGHLISVVRDPVSWFASAHRHQPHKYGELEPSIALWLESAGATLACHDEHPNRVTGILFEDLLHRTEAVMRRICERTQLSFADSLLAPTVNGRPALSNSSFILAAGIDQAPADRTAHLSADELSRIHEMAASLYRQAQARFAL